MKLKLLLRSLLCLTIGAACANAADKYGVNDDSQSGKATANNYPFSGYYYASGSAVAPTDNVWGIWTSGFDYSTGIGTAAAPISIEVVDGYNVYGALLSGTSATAISSLGNVYFGAISAASSNIAGRWTRGIGLANVNLTSLNVNNLDLQGTSAFTTGINPFTNGVEFTGNVTVGAMNLGNFNVEMSDAGSARGLNFATTTVSITTLTGNITVSSDRVSAANLSITEGVAGITEQGLVSSGTGGLRSIGSMEANISATASSNVAYGINIYNTAFTLNLAKGAGISAAGRDATASRAIWFINGTAAINSDGLAAHSIKGDIYGKTGVAINAGTYVFGSNFADSQKLRIGRETGNVVFNNGSDSTFTVDTMMSVISGAGVATAGSATFKEGSTVRLTADSLTDYVQLSGATLTLESGSFLYVVLANGFLAEVDATMTILSFTTSLTDNSTLKLMYENGQEFSSEWYTYANGVITFTAVPEPAVAAGLLGLLALVGVVRRRRK